MFVDSVWWLNMQAQCCNISISISTATPSPIRQPSTWRATAASENIGNGDRSRRLYLPSERFQAGGGSRKEDKASDSICHPADCRQQPVQIKKNPDWQAGKEAAAGREGGREIQSPDHPSPFSISCGRFVCNWELRGRRGGGSH